MRFVAFAAKHERMNRDEDALSGEDTNYYGSTVPYERHDDLDLDSFLDDSEKMVDADDGEKMVHADDGEKMVHADDGEKVMNVSEKGVIAHGGNSNCKAHQYYSTDSFQS